MSSEPIDQSAVAEELLTGWTAADGDRAHAEELSRLLVADWAREADPMPDPDAVLRYLREDLDKITADVGGSRLKSLEIALLQRRANQLNARAFSLASQVIDGTIDDEEARALGRVLLEECEVAASEIKGLGDSPPIGPISRSIQEAMLDALYVIERKAMSPRLAHARPGANAGPSEPGAPDIRP